MTFLEKSLSFANPTKRAVLCSNTAKGPIAFLNDVVMGDVCRGGNTLQTHTHIYRQNKGGINDRDLSSFPPFSLLFAREKDWI